MSERDLLEFVIRHRLDHRGRTLSERFYRTVCHCGNVRWLRRKDQHATECFFCSQSRKGKLAFAALVKSMKLKHGDDQGHSVSVWICKRYLDAHPTASESRLHGMLSGVEHEMNAFLVGTSKDYLADALVGNTVFEVNGGVHTLFQREDAEKYCAILNAGYNLIVVEDDDLSPDWLLKGWML